MTIPLLLIDAKNDGIARWYAGYGRVAASGFSAFFAVADAAIRMVLEAAGRPVGK